MGRCRRSLAIAAALLGGCGDNIHPGGGTLLVSPQIDLQTTESGGSTRFTVALSNEPIGDVAVDLTSMDTSEGTVAPATLTFGRDDFDQPQTVTITGVDDDRADGNKSYLVRVAAPFIGAVDLDVTNHDDDTAGFTVSPLLGLMTSETGTSAKFEVSLMSQPAADVTVPIASSDPTEGVTDRTTLVFNEQNWFTPQVVTVTGQQDSLSDGSISYTVVLGAAMSADDGYKGIDPDDVTLTNVDDDLRGITVTAPATLATSESGTQATFSVALQTQPTAMVTIPVASTNGNEATLSTPSLVFTPGNWNVAQTVTVTGVDDAIDDGDQPFSVAIGVATSTDTMYAGLDPADLAGVNADDDTAGIVVAPTSGLSTSEAGASDAFTVVLTSQPTADVTIAVASSDATEGVTQQSMLTFTPANWNQAQTVNVVGVDDLIADNAQLYTVVLSPAVSADTVYSGIDPSDVSVTNLDNDVSGVTVEPIDGLVVSEFGDTDTFTIVLNAAPTANVTITLTSSDTTEGTVAPSSVTFTPSNWNVPQTVTVTGINDTIADGNQIFTIITGAATSTDPAYSGLAVADVEVTNIDNDTAQVYVKARRRLLVSENGQSATFRVRLTLQPTATVTCTIQSSDTTEGLISPPTLVFQPNQFGFQTVTVTGVDDQIVDGDVLFTILLDACTSTDPQYNGSNPRDVTAINRDND
ncbi:MAG TPA: Calx-beta domain-containing protein [Kofleriaceae bacterium]